MSAAYKFLPWARQGLAAGINTPDDLGDAMPGRAAVQVRLEVNEVPIDQQVLIHSPGDLISIDTSEIVRTDPPPNTQDFEPNYFPLIEFDRPDFPWLFTPAGAGDKERLRPWLVLIVVREQDGVTLTMRKGQPLPVLAIGPPASPLAELPDLAESWAWAHAQVVNAETESIAELLAADSDRNLSRVLCPRRLEPDTRYRACLVPAFDTGRKAALGFAVSEADRLAPAWTLGPSLTAIELPVYFQWSFETGEEADFESLVRRLQGRPLPPNVGTRSMRVRDLGFELPDIEDVRFGGVLRAPGTQLDPIAAEFTNALVDLLNRPFNQQSSPDSDPIVGAPIYGRFHARLRRVPTESQQPVWLRQLNIDPRFRSMAGFGAMVVQDGQEDLMHSAWQQLAGIEEVRQLRVQAQFAMEAGRAVHAKHVSKLSLDRIYPVVSPLRSRVRPAARFTLQSSFNAFRVTPAATSTVFRRVTRPRGPLMRRLPPVTESNRRTAAVNLSQGLFLRIAGGGPQFPYAVFTQGMVTSMHVAQQLTRMEAAARLRISNPRLTVLRKLVPSAKAFNDYLVEVAKARRLVLFNRNPDATRNAFATMRTQLLSRLDPRVTVPPRVRHRQRLPDGTSSSHDDAVDPYAPMPHPQFHRPMYEPLADLSQNMLLPGLARVPPDTVTLAETDPRAIESYMTGLNHEMARELLWRRYPTDQRGTYFRHFWDSEGLPSAAATQMPPLHLWNADVALGQNFAGAGQGRLVLLIRGELLRRYPGAVIYAARPLQAQKFDPAEHRLPIFRGTLEPDVCFVGFQLTLAEVLETAGANSWYFVLQQPPTDARFGMDLPTGFGDGAGVLESPNDLNWGHMVDTAEQFDALTHASALGRLANRAVGGFNYGHNAAHMAALTLQRPVRIAIKASLILPPEVNGVGADSEQPAP